MSASEKLKSPNFDYRDDFDVVSWAALLAVVEAAEQLPEFFYDKEGQTHSFVPLLDALDEALG